MFCISFRIHVSMDRKVHTDSFSYRLHLLRVLPIFRKWTSLYDAYDKEVDTLQFLRNIALY